MRNMIKPLSNINDSRLTWNDVYRLRTCFACMIEWECFLTPMAPPLWVAPPWSRDDAPNDSILNIAWSGFLSVFVLRRRPDSVVPIWISKDPSVELPNRSSTLVGIFTLPALATSAITIKLLLCNLVSISSVMKLLTNLRASVENVV